MELQRRKWPTLEVGPLETWRKSDIIEAFLKRSLRARPTVQRVLQSGSRAPASVNDSSTFLTGLESVVEDGPTGNERDTLGKEGIEMAENAFKPSVGSRLVLFPSMIQAITSRYVGKAFDAFSQPL